MSGIYVTILGAMFLNWIVKVVYAIYPVISIAYIIKSKLCVLGAIPEKVLLNYVKDSHPGMGVSGEAVFITYNR